MVLEAAGEDPLAVGVERRADRVAGVRLDGLPSNLNLRRSRGGSPRRVAPAASSGAPGHPVPAPRLRISFVRVSRRHHPALAAEAVEPPLVLLAGDVVAEVQVFAQRVQRRRARRPRRARRRTANSVTGRGPQWGQSAEGHRSRNSQWHPDFLQRSGRGADGSTLEGACRFGGEGARDPRLPGRSGPLGTNEIARRTGTTAQHRLPPSRHARRVGARRP